MIAVVLIIPVGLLALVLTADFSPPDFFRPDNVALPLVLKESMYGGMVNGMMARAPLLFDQRFSMINQTTKKWVIIQEI